MMDVFSWVLVIAAVLKCMAALYDEDNDSSSGVMLWVDMLSTYAIAVCAAVKFVQLCMAHTLMLPLTVLAGTAIFSALLVQISRRSFGMMCAFGSDRMPANRRNPSVRELKQRLIAISRRIKQNKSLCRENQTVIRYADELLDCAKAIFLMLCKTPDSPRKAAFSVPKLKELAEAADELEFFNIKCAVLDANHITALESELDIHIRSLRDVSKEMFGQDDKDDIADTDDDDAFAEFAAYADTTRINGQAASADHTESADNPADDTAARPQDPGKQRSVQ